MIIIVRQVRTKWSKDEFEALFPFACDRCGAIKAYNTHHDGRYATERGLKQHMSRRHAGDAS